ncbi:hypothetical protein [Rhodococcus marinonascens]|uniref:hypothetical protein n=1 Tax=Rhodococcus marinonascens TaxID=38311 RepID=UPI0009347F57|nr:hypothetical protein [Rhodococcus marinonascens]
MTDTNTVASLPEWAQKMIGDLRSEAAEHRQSTKSAETERDGLRDELSSIHTKTALDGLTGVLADPEDLGRYVDTTELVGDDGKPDADKYAEAARALVGERPHLGKSIGRSGNEIGGPAPRPPSTNDPTQQIADGTADFVSLVQGAS